ncbi:MAG TPA: hypothetical protein DD001_17455 [Microcoleaceae bacterium UBA10368]|nr:hypothetical protein [Microcoleaceae cyanobacterium UBA10368]
MPKLTELKVKNNEEYLKKSQIYVDVMLLLWLMITIAVPLGSPSIVNLLYGKLYAPSGTILSI